MSCLIWCQPSTVSDEVVCSSQACDYNALVQFLEAVKTPEEHVHLLTMEAGYHELLMGPEHDEVMAGMLRFMIGETS